MRSRDQETREGTLKTCLLFSALGGLGFGFWQNSFGAGFFAGMVILVFYSFVWSLDDIADALFLLAGDDEDIAQ